MQILFLFIALCASINAAATPRPPLTGAALEERIAELSYTPWNGVSTLLEKKVELGCVTRKFELPVIEPNHEIRTISVILTTPPLARFSPLLVIAPTILGPSELENGARLHLCKQGVSSLIADVIHSIQPPFYPDWEYEDAVDLAAIRALRTTLDFAESLPEIDRTKMGMMGLSLGGIVTSMVAAVEPDRLQAVVLVASAGNIPYSLAFSTQPIIRKLRDARMRALGWTDPAVYEAKLRETITIDPNFFASKIIPSHMFMLMARFDKTVPIILQKESANYFGEPEQLFVPGNHYETIFAITQFYMKPIVQFLHLRFGQF